MFTALYEINKSVKTQENTKVNLKAMALHATSFGLFMVTTLCYMFVYVMEAYFDRMTGTVYNISNGIFNITSSLAQIVLCWIFWELGKKPEPQQRKPSPQRRRKVPVYVDEDSEEEEVKETIYNSAAARLAFRL